MTSPTDSSGTDSVTSMIGSSSTAPAAAIASRIAIEPAVRNACSERVDRVVAAVVEPHADALEREARDRPVGHRVLHALLRRPG